MRAAITIVHSLCEKSGILLFGVHTWPFMFMIKLSVQGNVKRKKSVEDGRVLIKTVILNNTSRRRIR